MLSHRGIAIVQVVLENFNNFPAEMQCISKAGYYLLCIDTPKGSIHGMVLRQAFELSLNNVFTECREKPKYWRNSFLACYFRSKWFFVIIMRNNGPKDSSFRLNKVQNGTPRRPSVSPNHRYSSKNPLSFNLSVFSLSVGHAKTCTITLDCWLQSFGSGPMTNLRSVLCM